MGGEVGIEWVKNYHGRAGNLTNTKSQAEGFYNRIDCTRRFNWGDDLAWDIDFEEPGDDHRWVDNVDIVFFSGHGSKDGPYFGVSTHDDGEARPSEIKWGNRDLEWIAFDACEILKYEGVWDRWRDAFKGLHYILGFRTTCSDEKNRGKYFALLLNMGWKVRDAWILACQLTEGSGTKMAYLRAAKSGTNTLNDHLWGHGYVSPDPRPPGVSLVYYSHPC